MKPRIEKKKMIETAHVKEQRERFENKMTAIPPLTPEANALMTAEGFADYYLEMVPMYPTQLEAYERLEDFHIAITGRRKYSEFGSFRQILNRYLKKCRTDDTAHI